MGHVKFTQALPVGLYDLRRRIGIFAHERGIFQRYQHRFLAADIAWFAAGLSTDASHTPPTNAFFPEFDTLRRNVPSGPLGTEARKSMAERIQTLTYDLATGWDRLYGGTTMILHMDGTTVPNTPSEPEYLRCSVYLPPSFVDNNPASHPMIAQIVQHFIEGVGVPTVQTWRNLANARGWPLTMAGPAPHANPTSPTLIRRRLLVETLQAHIASLEQQLLRTTSLMTSRRTTPPLHSFSPLGLHSRSPTGSHSGQCHSSIHPVRQRSHTPANALRSPPPYSPSRRLVASSPQYEFPEANNDIADVATFIRVHGLDVQAQGIHLVFRVVAQAKWYEELTALGIPGQLASGLVDLGMLENH
ncbi:hypothetical protein B0H10DRAFT_1948429 [Mycena sp. CBHHK59/15]|nr:hypothetical protein B0H10DRAFT_1948429 [Mycena sp. CBHHK59/15]